VHVTFCGVCSLVHSLIIYLQGRLLTGAAIGLVIAGGAYVSTVDEATFWYFIWEFER